MAFGSVNNLFAAAAANPEPVEGMGATVIAWTDRYPATIMAVRRNRKGEAVAVTLREDHAERTDNRGMSEWQDWAFSPNPDGQVFEFTRRRNGRFIQKGARKGQGYAVRFGTREKYYDFSF